jgi:hypothetical protein
MTFTVTDLKTITMIAIMAFVIRIVAGMAVGWEKLLPAPDQSSYDALAKSILAGKGFQIPDIDEQGQSNNIVQEEVKKPGYLDIVVPGHPTAFFQPLYPLIMAAAYGILGEYPGSVRLLQGFFDALACFLIGWMGIRMFGSRQGILAALIYSIYPAFVALTLVLLPISLGVFVLVLAMALTVNFQENPASWPALWMGLAWGVAALCISVILPFLLVVLLLAWWEVHRLRLGEVSKGSSMGGKSMLPANRQLIYPLIIVLGMVIILSPWAIRNAMVMGHFTVLPTKEGQALYEANNGIFSQAHLESSTSGEGMAPIYHRFAVSHLNQLKRADLIEFPQFPDDMGEFQRDEILTRQAVDFVLANPKVAADLCLLRLYSLIRIIPGSLHDMSAKLISMVSMGGILIFALLGLIIDMKYWVRTSYFYLLILYYVVIHAVTASGIPQRLPLDAILILFAAGSLIWFYESISGNAE